MLGRAGTGWRVVLAVLLAGAAFGLAPAASAWPGWTRAAGYPLPIGAAPDTARLGFATGGVATVAYIDTSGTLHAGTIAPGEAYDEQLQIGSASRVSLAEAPDGAAVLEWASRRDLVEASYRRAGAVQWSAPLQVAPGGGTLVTAVSPAGQAAAAVSPAQGGFSLTTFDPGTTIDLPAAGESTTGAPTAGTPTTGTPTTGTPTTGAPTTDTPTTDTPTTDTPTTDTPITGTPTTGGSTAGEPAGSEPTAPTGLALGYDRGGELTLAYALAKDLVVQTVTSRGAVRRPATVARDLSTSTSLSGAGASTALAVASGGSAVISYAGVLGAEAIWRERARGGWSAPVVVTRDGSPLAAAISPAAQPYLITPANQAIILFSSGDCVGVARAAIQGRFSVIPCLARNSAVRSSGALAFIGDDAYAVWSGAAGVRETSWPGGSRAPAPVAALARSGSLTQLIADQDGSIAALWTARGALRASAFDASGPVLVSAMVPVSTTVDASVTMTATFADLWSSIPQPPVWSFGDATSIAGAQVAHTYGAPGVYTVTVTVTDRLGNATTASFTVTVLPRADLSALPLVDRSMH